MDPHELPFGQPTRGCVLAWKKEANLAGRSAAGALAWTGTCMWTKQTANGGRDMGKQPRKSAKTDHSRMRGDCRPEKHLSVQTGQGRDGEEEKNTVKEKEKKKKEKEKEKQKERARERERQRARVVC